MIFTAESVHALQEAVVNTLQQEWDKQELTRLCDCRYRITDLTIGEMPESPVRDCFRRMLDLIDWDQVEERVGKQR